MGADEAWKYLLRLHKNFHNGLKNFGYTYWTFIPRYESMVEMFDKPSLTDQDIEKYYNKFMKFYNVKHLQRFDEIFESWVKPKLMGAINKFLVPLLPSWNAVLPKKLDILCTYGHGAGYNRESDDVAIIYFRMSESRDNENGVLNTFFHEFVHMLIQKPIISKYDVPQDLKERIVDLICYEFIRAPKQEMFENSFANAYITPDVIKNDLPATVQKMMIDYKAKKV